MEKRGRKPKKKFFDERGREWKNCARCHEMKVAEEFQRSPSYCNYCYKQYQKEYRETKGTSIEEQSKQKSIAATKRCTEKDIETMPQEELDKFINNLYTIQKQECIYSGQKMSLEKNRLDSMSIDRIKSYITDKDGYKKKLGYLPSNIVLCTKSINIAKNQMPYSEFLRQCKMVVHHYESMLNQGTDLLKIFD